MERIIGSKYDKAVIAAQAALGFRLKEVRGHTGGNWLVFTDEPYTAPRNALKEIDELKAKVKALEDKVR